eukprot:6778680-Pyramimonas_sp.AAC.1
MRRLPLAVKHFSPREFTSCQIVYDGVSFMFGASWYFWRGNRTMKRQWRAGENVTSMEQHHPVELVL